MAHIRQSFSWWCFVRDPADAERIVSGAARIGYEGCELLGEEFWPLARRYGLTIAAVPGHESLADGLNRRENHDRIEQEVRDRLKQAVAWGIPNLICFSGNRNGLDDCEGMAVTAEGLARLAPLAENAGVTLVLELLNSKVDHPDYQADHTKWGLEVCRMVGSPRVKLLYDIYHMQIMEGDVIRTISDAAPMIGHYHTAGVPGRRDMDDAQELYYPAIVRAIARSGYEGFVGHEFLPKGDPVEALRTAYELCNVH